MDCRAETTPGAMDTQPHELISRELELDDDTQLPSGIISERRSCRTVKSDSTRRKRPPPSVRFHSQEEVHVVDRYEDDFIFSDEQYGPSTNSISSGHLPPSTQSPLPARTSMMGRFGAVALLLAAAVPLLQSTSYFGHASLPITPVSGGPVPGDSAPHGSVVLDRRADSPTDVCFRWAQQSAIINGTLYLYGGQATTEPLQTQNTWNNNFLSLDLTKTWQIASPSLTGLPQPSGPPSVSLGYLWHSHESLFLYGGEFDWKPAQSPTPFALWEYDVASTSWIEHSDPVTSSGNSAPSNDQPVERAAEGAGVSVPSLGRGFYFGGHQDGYTTQGWSQSIPRIYLQSLLEYTYPEYPNDQVDSLSNGKDAGSNGVFRNITEGGLQSQAGFTQRADGLLVYVPGFADQGILLALAGGTNETFTQMNNINVYDIAKSSWYTQATSGDTPEIRVNPCAVIAAAPDGSSYNIYMFGGQNLIPAGNQTQYNDMWILTLPTFTWIKVDQGGQVPYGRSGHTCNVWDAQMVMVGGYTGDEGLSCESPGIYVFDLSALQWVNQFTAASPGTDDGSASSSDGGSGSTGSNNPFNQQLSQKYTSDSPGGLEGSYNYEVPDAVISVVGGGKTGGATLTAPVNTATAGPLATGKPITYTVTNADGSTATGTTGAGSGGSGGNSSKKSGPNVGAIVAGCIAGVLFVIACYLAFCAYVYRKQVQMYKRHLEMSQARMDGEKATASIHDGFFMASASKANSNPAPSDTSYRRGELGPWMTNASEAGRSSNSQGDGGNLQYSGGYNSVRRSSDTSVTNEAELLGGKEPTFVGVMLNPRRSLRVINRD